MKQTRRVPFNIEKAKQGAKVVTKNGLNVIIREYCDDELYNYPIEAIVKNPADDTCKDTLYYTKEGRLLSSSECDLDLLIEEEEEPDYNPYKETVKSIADMVERYSELQSLEELKDFYDNVKVKCREAIEYDKKWCKNQDEKPADNKPKFKKGDWVIDIDKPGVVHQITDVTKNVTNHTYGYNAVSFTYGVFGYSYFSDKVKSMRLWKFNDAKDGDVLASENWLDIVIFRQIDTSKTFSSYYNIRGRENVCWNNNCFIPATKEQRELLFQKMKEAGYEWNADKKELHKIERRMTHQELSWWLRDCPEEHREFKFKCDGLIFSSYEYRANEADTPVEENRLLIRRNHGAWQEPLIEI